MAAFGALLRGLAEVAELGTGKHVGTFRYEGHARLVYEGCRPVHTLERPEGMWAVMEAARLECVAI